MEPHLEVPLQGGGEGVCGGCLASALSVSDVQIITIV